MDDKYIAYCGLDCRKCEAWIATQNNDDELRKKVAKEWSIWNHTEITPEMINCDGCRLDGKKTPFCDSLCPIKNCASNMKMNTCGRCSHLYDCDKLKMITDHDDNAINNLINNEKD